MLNEPNSIYVDFDDVLCQTARGAIEIARRRFGSAVVFEDIHSFDLGQSFGLGSDELAELMELLHEPEVLLGLSPVEGAAMAVDRWADRGYDICVVTGRPPETEEASHNWLAHHGIRCSSVLFVDKYGRGSDGGSRAAPMSDLGGMDFCLAVEDSADMAMWLADNTDTTVAVLHRPWNASMRINSDATAGIVRCRDWPEVSAKFPAPACRP